MSHAMIRHHCLAALKVVDEMHQRGDPERKKRVREYLEQAMGAAEGIHLTPTPEGEEEAEPAPEPEQVIKTFDRMTDEELMAMEAPDKEVAGVWADYDLQSRRAYLAAVK